MLKSKYLAKITIFIEINKLLPIFYNDFRV